MSQKYTLLIDMDGVICDWYGRVLEVYRERYPDRPIVHPEDVTQFWVEELYPEEHQADVVAVTREIGFYESLAPLPGAIGALKEMEQDCQGFIEPFICSSPEVEYSGLRCHSEKAAWVDRYLGSWWTKRLILTKDKTLVRGHFLIDDKPVIRGCMEPTWGRLVFDQPYNRDIIGNGRFSWEDWPKLKALLAHLAEQQRPEPQQPGIFIARPEDVCRITTTQ